MGSDAVSNTRVGTKTILVTVIANVMGMTKSPISTVYTNLAKAPCNKSYMRDVTAKVRTTALDGTITTGYPLQPSP